MGVVPTDSTGLGREKPETIVRLLASYWEVVSQDTGLAPKQIAEQALIAPARCCLKNIGQVGAAEDASGQNEQTYQLSSTEEGNVGKAFAYLREISGILKNRYGL